jgi:predicted anti-sigma-YlaC factor YlaD
MKCREFGECIGEYVDGELAASLKADFDRHMAECLSCRKSYESIAGAWESLKGLPETEPSPAFVSRFWTKVAAEGGARREHPAILFKNVFLNRKWVPVAMVLSAFVVFVSFNVIKIDPVGNVLSQLSGSDLELIENFELVEHFDVINDLEELQDADVIQELDHLQS